MKRTLSTPSLIINNRVLHRLLLIHPTRNNSAKMAMTQDQLRSLDNLRQRLSQLSTSISSLKTSLEREEPLPTW
jgi:hypothetical protein